MHDLLELPQSLQASFGTVLLIRPGLPPQLLSSMFDMMRCDLRR